MSDDLIMRLIEVAEELDEISTELEERDVRSAAPLATTAENMSTLCFDMSHILEIAEGADSESYRIDDDQVLTDGGVRAPLALTDVCQCGHDGYTVTTYYKYPDRTFAASRCPSCGSGLDIKEVPIWSPEPPIPERTVEVTAP